MRRVFKLPVLIGVGALIGGTGFMVLLLSMQNSDALSATQNMESALRVEALRVHPARVPVVIEGHGQVHVRKTVRIAPEVSGRVVSIHPNLIAGGRVPEGEPLFEIDDQPYKALVADAEGTVAQLEASVSRLREESKNEQARLESLQRARDIALAQFERLKELFAEDVGTQTGVDAAEAEYVAARDEVDKLTHQLGLYPIRIDEAQCALDSARSRLDLARLNLEKTRVICPFDARVKERSIEKDQYAAESVDAVELADDSVLEIPVPLDSRDARRWLRFRRLSAGNEAMWFGDPEPVECAVYWTEDERAALWTGTLDRVESFDETSRTLTVVVRVSGTNHQDSSARLPLVEGMFCRVEIPGQAMEDVFTLPQSAVNIDNTVFLAVENRLKTASVEVQRQQDSFAYVSGGLEPGDLVVTTRLIKPLDHSLLDITVLPDTVQ